MCRDNRRVDGSVGSDHRPAVPSLDVAALVLAAGQGTRMKSGQAKVLFEVASLPLIEWPLRRLDDVGASPVVIVVGHQAQAVQSYVEGRDSTAQARFALQTQRLGTGHAARVGLEQLAGFEGIILILYGDVPLLETSSLRSLLEAVDPPHRPLALISAEFEDPSGYGRVLRDEAGNVVRIVEHKDATTAERACREVNAGIYAAEAAFLRRALAGLSNQNAQGEYYLTDIVDAALAEDLEVAGLEIDAEEVQGANDRAQLAVLERLAHRRTIARHMAAGVTFLDPAHTSVGVDVEIGRDSVIHSGVHLRGKTRVGPECHVDVGCILTDTTLDSGVSVHPYSVLEGARVQSGCSVGPFARLRPETMLGPGARVGNFVEVKKSVLGPGSKANHLAYVGDSSVGALANIGAGTITCNYDGVGKSPTEIGEGVFVGSNSTLVAPVTLSAGSYVAAGSVLTEDVPENALALGRARQVNKPGRAAQVREAAKDRKKASERPQSAQNEPDPQA